MIHNPWTIFCDKAEGSPLAFPRRASRSDKTGGLRSSFLAPEVLPGIRGGGGNLPGNVVEANATEAVVASSTDSSSTCSFDVQLTAILVVAGVLRLSILLIRSSKTSRFLSHDSASYLTLSRDFDAFASTSNPHFSLSMLRTPVYPLYLAATREMTGSSIVGPMLLQVLVAVGLVYVTYRLGLSLFGRSAALWAALFLAVDPLSIIYSSLVLTDMLFTFFLAWSVLLLWRPTDNRWARGLASGLLLGVATLTRPVSLYLSVVLTIGYLILEREHLRRAAVVALSFIVGFGLVAGGWVIRNDVMGGVSTISTIEGHNLLYFRAVGALEEGQNLQPYQAYSYVSTQLRTELPPHPSLGQIDRVEESIGRTIILNNPIGYAKEVISGGGRLAFGTGSAESVPATAGHATDVVDTYGDLYLLVLYVLVVVGLWVAWREHRLRNCLLPLIVIFYLAIVSSGLDAYSRFRVPIMPFLALLAGLGAMAIIGSRERSTVEEPLGSRRDQEPR
jgi:4-amino-4-deoxy-L-arabinose transferase-like glycosyltransferase